MKFFRTEEQDNNGADDILGVGFLTKREILYAPPSHGNLGQLSADLLLSSQTTNQCRRVGVLESKYLSPITGLDRFGDLGQLLVFPLEVYLLGETILLQQRSPPQPQQRNAFIQELIEFLSKLEFTSLTIFAGAGTYLHNNNNNNNNNKRLFYFSQEKKTKFPFPYCTDFLSSAPKPNNNNNNNNKGNDDEDFSEAEYYERLLSNSSSSQQQQQQATLTYKGVEFVQAFFQTAIATPSLSNNNNNITVVGLFCEEGNNVLDAKTFVTSFVNLCHPSLATTTTTTTGNGGLREPESWQHLFGISSLRIF